MSSDGLTLRERLVDITIGSAAETCTPPMEPVKFGQKFWLAQHRWLEPTAGFVALFAMGLLYLLSFQILSSALAWGLMAAWASLLVGSVVLWIRRPCTVLRLPIHAMALWIVVVVIASAAGVHAH